MIYHHLAKFGGNGSGDIMVLNCHVISQDHLTQEPWDFLSTSP